MMQNASIHSFIGSVFRSLRRVLRTLPPAEYDGGATSGVQDHIKHILKCRSAQFLAHLVLSGACSLVFLQNIMKTLNHATLRSQIQT